MNEELDETALLRLRVEYLEHHIARVLFDAGKLSDLSSNPAKLVSAVDALSRLVNNTRNALADYNPHRINLPEHRHYFPTQPNPQDEQPNPTQPE